MTKEERKIAEAAIQAPGASNPMQLDSGIATVVNAQVWEVKEVLDRLVDDGYIKVCSGPAINFTETGAAGPPAKIWYEKDRVWPD